MKTSLRSFLTVSTVIVGLAIASSAHAGEGAAYWQNRASSAKAAKAPSAEVVANSTNKTVPSSGDQCSSSCCAAPKSKS